MIKQKIGSKRYFPEIYLTEKSKNSNGHLQNVIKDATIF